MSTAVLEKKTVIRLYIYGKGVVTRQQIRRDVWLNRRALRYNDLLVIRNFTIGYGVATIGLRITSAKREGRNCLAIKGFTTDGVVFNGSYDFKTGTGTINVG